ncbi:prolyl oligopeptidase family serine peptidase [Paracrocinitomix mangrovi]|uniref:alpha/beta hydrolase family protein n=1 Tax=Paracrocinitomix mangrovi TaxID=2862509 RepID=UPI001C8DA1B7|nr:prolyl oligopeptidase family serine peptidase [Paracrocinitomix mangrovi]UKN00528.1 prolyl oligopeptidase family serine peptidase [Paracrocinitomix mangrovi]
MSRFNLNPGFFSLLCGLFIGFNAISQKKTISPEMYDEWQSISTFKQTPSGKWITYEVKPLDGDQTTYILSAGGDVAKEWQRATNTHLHYKDQFACFIIQPAHDSVRKLKLEKAKKSQFPDDSLGIYMMANDSLIKLANIKSYKAAKEGDWIAYLSTKDNRPVPASKKKKKKKKKKGNEPPKTSGTTLTVYNPTNGTTSVIHRVTDYSFSENGNKLAYVSSIKGEKDSLTVHVIDLVKDETTTLIENSLGIEKLTFDEDGKQLVFLSSLDTGKVKNYALAYWQEGQHNAHIIVDSLSKDMPEEYTVSQNGQIYFSENGEKIFFGISEIQREEPKDTLLETEKAHVDIWAGDDSRIQPEQLKRLKRDQNSSFLSVYHIKRKKFVQLESESLEHVSPLEKGNSEFALASDDQVYQRERTWEYPWRRDYYIVYTSSGRKEILKEGLYFGGSISPGGHYFVYYNHSDSSWYSKDILAKKEKKISANGLKFADDLNGQPAVADPFRTYGWTKFNDDYYYAVSDGFDIWYLHPNKAEQSFCMTNKIGSEQQIKFSIWRTENDSLYFAPDRVIIHGFDENNKDELFYSLNRTENGFGLKELLRTNHKIIGFNKAKESEQVLIRRMNFYTYPDLEITNTDFDNFAKISEVNPQQKEYNWGTVEFVEWYAYDSTKLRGLLYKPEDFDSTKSYPMITYYYETYTDNINNYYAPKPTASIVYPTEYVSNGYIFFVPDIKYTPGYPAKSAYNCIVSGTDYLTRKYNWIDSTRMGIQGQSWGGYQTAQLITMTGKYKAAMAGAPVSNMFSAYGGVRWGSGLSRMFQYEHSQSRIGATIWEKPELYIENSPIFHLPNVTTPLLIMHNDGDGAVPWYQGIELYMGLRRLDKDVWLLNYNNDEHNLMKQPNRRDLSVRMRQFFDYYLQDAPMPNWMKYGLPALDKGERNGYELEK